MFQHLSAARRALIQSRMRFSMGKYRRSRHCDFERSPLNRERPVQRIVMKISRVTRRVQTWISSSSICVRIIRNNSGISDPLRCSPKRGCEIFHIAHAWKAGDDVPRGSVHRNSALWYHLVNGPSISKINERFRLKKRRGSV